MEHEDELDGTPSPATELSLPLEIRIRLDMELLRELTQESDVCPDSLVRELDRVAERQPAV